MTARIFAAGAIAAFLKVSSICPSAGKVQPIVHAMEAADIIILDSPNYVLEMNSSMKNLMDHLAYRWVTHRPCGEMFTKIGITVSSSAGAPAGHTTRSMARQLKWMGVSKVYCFPFICNALGVSDLKAKKRAELERKAAHIAKKTMQRVKRSHPSLRGKLFFSIFHKMQSSLADGWNPTNRDWWVSHGWTKGNRPWHK